MTHLYIEILKVYLNIGLLIEVHEQIFKTE